MANSFQEEKKGFCQQLSYFQTSHRTTFQKNEKSLWEEFSPMKFIFIQYDTTKR